MYRYTYVPHTYNGNAKNGGPEDPGMEKLHFWSKTVYSQ